ncbi:hypothetical protein JW905_00085 [bacterium]|nr:hypothetical protein [candidate division CSSED10-310 bacterium]
MRAECLISLCMLLLGQPVMSAGGRTRLIECINAVTGLPIMGARIYPKLPSGSLLPPALTDSNGRSVIEEADGVTAYLACKQGYCSLELTVEEELSFLLVRKKGRLIIAQNSMAAMMPAVDVWIDGRYQGLLPLEIDTIDCGYHCLMCLPVDSLGYTCPVGQWFELAPDTTTFITVPVRRNLLREAGCAELAGDLNRAQQFVSDWRGQTATDSSAGMQRMRMLARYAGAAGMSGEDLAEMMRALPPAGREDREGLIVLTLYMRQMEAVDDDVKEDWLQLEQIMKYRMALSPNWQQLLTYHYYTDLIRRAEAAEEWDEAHRILEEYNGYLAGHPGLSEVFGFVKHSAGGRTIEEGVMADAMLFN